jgi:hypothetical protein
VKVTDPLAGTSWLVRRQRLHLGLEPIDALGRPGPIGDVGVHHENVAEPAALPPGVDVPAGPATAPAFPMGAVGQGMGLPGLVRSRSGRFAISFAQYGLEPLDDDAHIVLRVTSPGRRYVPRRLSVPAPSLTDVVADELVPRACRPWLYPAATYGIGAGETAIRGRALWDAGANPPTEPVRWARVVARTHDAVEVHHLDDSMTLEHPIVGRAHGDDNGEFLLVLGPLPLQLAVAASSRVVVDVEVRGRASIPLPLPSPSGSTGDPLWDLPIERLLDLDPAGDVLRGVADPTDYTAAVTRTEDCRRGAVHRPPEPFVVAP